MEIENFIVSKKNFQKKIENIIINYKQQLTENNESEIIIKFLEKMKFLLRKSKEKFSQLKSVEEKEEFIKELFDNLDFLLNYPKYELVYNSDIIFKKDEKYFQDLKSIEQLITYNGLEKEGGDCNCWVYVVYNILKYILQDDKIFEFNFITQKSDNHGCLVIYSPNYLFLYQISGTHEFWYSNTNHLTFSDKLFINSKNLENFKKIKKEIGFKKPLQVYKAGKNKFFKIIRFGPFVLVGVKEDNTNLNYCKIYGLRRISKKLAKLKYFKFLGLNYFIKKLNYQEIIDLIKSRFPGSKKQEFIERAIKKLEKSKFGKY